MKIRHAKETDLQRIMEIYSCARTFMALHGNPNQWGATNWPPERVIRNDISNQKSYVCEVDGTVVGVFFFDSGIDIEPTYREIEGAWIGSNQYGVVHRIATDGSVRGVGTFCINWALKQCNRLRIDTHPDNKVMQGLLQKLGFQTCGFVHVVEDNHPRIAYEKEA